MNKNWTLTLLFVTLCGLPLAAQETPANAVQAALERHAAQAQLAAGQQDVVTAPADPSDVSSVQDRLAAETQAQLDRNRNYLPSEQVASEKTNDLTPLSPQELIEAEEELALLTTRDNHATFNKYPYLLDPAYRRANDEVKEQIRKRFSQRKAHYAAYDPHKGNTTWAWKVGL